MTTRALENEEKYVVVIPTASGNAVIESREQWNTAEFVGAYIATIRRYKDSKTNRVPVSRFFTNSPNDAR